MTEKKKHQGFQCDGLSPNFVVHCTLSRSHRPLPRLIWHHRTIEDVAAFLFQLRHRMRSMGHVAAKTQNFGDFGGCSNFFTYFCLKFWRHTLSSSFFLPSHPHRPNLKPHLPPS
jgi:hypothetical protein